MLWVKTFHVFFVIAWFAGLFYLPRIYVNLAQVDRLGSPAEHQRLLGMARRLYRFTLPFMVLAIALGMVLWLGFGIGRGAGWIHAKFTLVLLLAGYHGYCGRLLRGFERGGNTRSSLWFRVFNELPVLVLFAVLALVTVKPF